MKTAIRTAAPALLVSLMMSSAAMANSTCNLVFNASSQQAANAMSWRSTVTNVLPGEKPANTSDSREKWLEASKEAMLKFLYQKTDTPEMVFAVEEGVVSQVPQVAVQNPSRNTIPLNYSSDPAQQGFHYERVPRISVSNLGPSGLLKGTLLLPVSGHTGIPNAEKWSKIDTYDIYVQDQSGRRVATIVSKAPSLSMITAQEVQMTLQPNQVYSLLYHRSGSGGPAGYSDGRTYEIVWDGK